MSYRKRPWAVYGKAGIIKVDRKCARTGCSFPREKKGEKKKTIKRNWDRTTEEKMISDFILCLVHPNNKQTKNNLLNFFWIMGKRKSSFINLLIS